jgi:hypothetical protein
MYRVSDNHREYGRYDICVEDDESRYLTDKYESSSEIDESDIYKKPKETIGQYPPDLLDDRSMGPERVESSSDEYETPYDHARYDKWYELLIRDIWYRQLDEWYPVTHQSE